MSTRCVVVLLTRPSWAPPGVDRARWRQCLAEDVVDLLTALADVDVAIATTAEDRPLADAIRWPGMPVYEVPGARPGVVAALAAAARQGYESAVVLAADVPDLPALLIGKLFRPLTTRAVALAPVLPGGPGLIGLAARLPAPAWLVAADPDLATDGVDELRAAARSDAGVGRPAGVATAPGWHRLRTPADLPLLDPALEGWENTRLLLS